MGILVLDHNIGCLPTSVGDFLDWLLDREIYESVREMTKEVIWQIIHQVVVV